MQLAARSSTRHRAARPQVARRLARDAPAPPRPAQHGAADPAPARRCRRPIASRRRWRRRSRRFRATPRSPAPRIAEGLAIARAVDRGHRRDGGGRRRADGGRADAGAVPGGRCGLRAAEGRSSRQRAASWCATRRPSGSTRRSRRSASRSSTCCRRCARALPGPDLFFQETVHLTPRGHEVVAAALDRFIERPAAASALIALTASHGLQLPSLRLVLRRRLRRLPACCRTARRTGCCSSRATTSTRRGTGASSACSSPRRSSTTAARCALARTSAPAARRALLVLSLGFNLTLLGFFKYFNFFADNLHARVRRARLAASTSSRCACCCRSASRSTRS